MVELFQTVTRIEPRSAAERLEQRRDRANRIRFLMNNGVSTATIALDMGISRARVYQLLAFADLADRMDPPESESEPIELDPLKDERPAWSYPDAITLALCHEIAAEMRAALSVRGCGDA